MKTSVLKVLLFLISVNFLSGYKILVGRTGVGKSYIVTLLGCPAKSCDSSESCTKDAFICSKEKIIDTMGLDDDESHEITYNGKQIKLSGFIYPLYNLFEHIEKYSINQAEFFFVYDSNNIREGQSSNALKKFLKHDLKCPFKRILNKYRDVHKSRVQQDDILITEYSSELDIGTLTGIPCSFGLTKNWRDRLINQDLEGVRSQLDVVKCNLLATTKKQYDEILTKKEIPLDDTDCSYNIITGYECVEYGLLWGCWRRAEIYSKKINNDCVVRRDARNKHNSEKNILIAQEKEKIYDLHMELLKEMVDCHAIANFNMD